MNSFLILWIFICYSTFFLLGIGPLLFWHVFVWFPLSSYVCHFSLSTCSLIRRPRSRQLICYTPDEGKLSRNVEWLRTWLKWLFYPFFRYGKLYRTFFWTILKSLVKKNEQNGLLQRSKQSLESTWQLEDERPLRQDGKRLSPYPLHNLCMNHLLWCAHWSSIT